MTEIASVSRSDLSQRRQHLRRQRRWKLLQSFWRIVAVSGITGGLVWVTTLPVWILRQPSQIQIEGNEVIATETIQDLLPIDYPESILTIQPLAIADYLEAQAPIAHATVTRRLLPPGLVIQIQERYPVAIVLPEAGMTLPLTPISPENAPPPVPYTQAGLIDEKGFWMSLEGYVALNQRATLPELTVIGMKEQYRSQWEQLYPQLIQSPVAITAIDWNDPANLILSTEMGTVHCGPYTENFPIQLQVLDQMRQLPEQLNLEQLDHIDLSNPDRPLVQLVQDQRQPITLGAEEATDD